MSEAITFKVGGKTYSLEDIASDTFTIGVNEEYALLQVKLLARILQEIQKSSDQPEQDNPVVSSTQGKMPAQ